MNAARSISATIIRTCLWQFHYDREGSEAAWVESSAKVAGAKNDRNGQIKVYRARFTSAAEQTTYDDF
ncbi:MULTISPECIES: hypothetical protein [Methylorubrum]|uniref:hypothetical protein n=1 Tax=Methylorubrum TaxID=2282523 RepID=UPI00209F6CB6|nr:MULTISPECIES: hypothetical protein [Methylorubrum]MCP1547251.1 hypothetical protein [Methylorubrum zatmanii]MCP1556133.1 hypothetical protein [Methylorubrum extorquens]MCP1577554.1 hypothetical protein [Methylorubrum extorquens]